MVWFFFGFFQVYITNLSKEYPVRVNCQVIDKPVKFNHGDVLTVIDPSVLSASIKNLQNVRKTVLMSR